MIQRIDLRNADPIVTAGRDYREVLPRAEFDIHQAIDAIKPVCDAVKTGGSAAVLDAGERFDRIRPTTLRVSADDIARAESQLDPQVRAAIEESIARLRRTSQAELESSVSTTVANGATVERRIVPMQRVGLYVPGGLAPLVSTVIMNAVPAQVAGVPQLALASPPQAEFGGLPHPTVLAACAILGISEVYAAGGAQAIAMFGYGTEDCPAVNLVTGPGNIYVAAAKRLLQGTVAIDSEAGPTEIAVIADDSANAAYVAADLISQSEHDPLAASILITDSPTLADAVDAELSSQVSAAKHADRIIQSLTGQQSATVLVADLAQAIEVANAYAAEHLEIQTRDAAQVADQIVNAGAVFVGSYTPVSLGDYVAGSNHVLPTAGCACHSSGLSVRAFCKNMHVVKYSRDALAGVAEHVVALAEAEDLPSHGAAVTIREARS